MTNQLQESIFKSIDTLVSQRIDTLKLDKTVTATIISCTNALTRQYKVSYNGGFMTVYANEGKTYNQNAEVYVLIPEGDFTKTKYIISKAQAITNDKNMTFVSSALNNYNIIGRNTLNTQPQPIGLDSYYKEDCIMIYDRERPYVAGSTEEKYFTNNNLLSISFDELNNNLKEAEAIMIEANFRTSLPKIHQISKTGTYGLCFTLAFKNSSVSEVQKLELQEKVDEFILPKLKDKLTAAAFLNLQASWDELQQEIWSNGAVKYSERQDLFRQLQNKVSSWYNNNINYISTEQKTIILIFLSPELLTPEDKSVVNEDQESYIKYVDYIIDNNNMTGNPFLYTTDNKQYIIQSIDVENFLYIQRIYFYSKNFEEKDKVHATNDNIFVKDIGFYGLKTINAVNDTCRLSLSTPSGSTFKSILETDKLEVIATFKDGNLNLSNTAQYYWFVEDNKITPSSEYYQYYAGRGWKHLKNNTKEILILSASDNKAYENKYLCVCVYNDTVILKEKFTIYNDSVRRLLEISSSLGTKFSFDTGVPKLTCLVNGKSENFESEEINPHADDLYEFIWSKTDENNNTIIFNQTIEDIDKEYQRVLNDSTITKKTSLLLDLEEQKRVISGVNFEKGKNWIEYPTKDIITNSFATFRCSVYLKDTPTDKDNYSIGSTEIKLQNVAVASPTDFYIVIENGDQVFQYSESGVSPDDTRYAEPLEIKPLSCKFYYPTGEEVNSAQYNVKWKVPLENSLIVVPKEGMEVNPVNDKIEWNISPTYKLMINSNYDYQALNNQITCIVNFNSQEYTKDTTFLFTKVGENGTNGTDLVAKAYAVSTNSILQEEPLTLILSGNKVANPAWNTGQTIKDKVVNINLYQRNQLLDSGITTSWKVSGSKGKYLSINNGVITWKESEYGANELLRNLIVRGDCLYQGNHYYSFLGIPVIKYNLNGFKVGIDTELTLKSITYNADGRNPLYNKNQGVHINIKDGKKKFIVWTAEGGPLKRVNGIDVENTPSFKLLKNKNDKNGQITLEPDKKDSADYEDLSQIYILPNDIYTGEYSNNLVHGKIYSSEKRFKDYPNNPDIEVYIPIYMSLNTYGLASLNSWDGNHIEINENDNYILAPQIGAGIKENDNTFTGIVMGEAKTYDSSESDVGLLGYSKGKQSIFLDAKSGNAAFGLPEGFNEGRIELKPGGISTIGSWKIGSTFLYNSSAEELETTNLNTYNNKPVGAKGMLKHDASGILLNANPSFISLKTAPITNENASDFGIDFSSSNMAITSGDSIELELDPSKGSIFSIYRHTKQDDKGNISDKNSYRREQLVGIDSSGKFFTNSLKNGTSSMGIGYVDGFGVNSSTKTYIGSSFAVDGKDFFKFFRTSQGDASSATTYISGGNKPSVNKGSNEYIRPLSFHGSSLSLFAQDDKDSNSNNYTSSNRIIISKTESYIGHTDNHLNIKNTSSSTSDSILKVANNLNLIASKDRKLIIKSVDTNNNQYNSINFYSNTDSSQSYKMVIDAKGGRKDSVTGNYYTITGNYSLNATNGINMTSNTNTHIINATNNQTNSKLHLGNSGEATEIYARNKFNLFSEYGGICLRANYTGEGILLETSNNADRKVSLSMTTNSSGKGQFVVNAAGAGILTTADFTVDNNPVQSGFNFSSPVLFSNGGIFLGTTNIKHGDAPAALYVRDNHAVINNTLFAGSLKWLSPGGHLGIRLPNNDVAAEWWSDDVWAHIDHIYWMLSRIGHEANENRKNADTGIAEAKRDAANAQNSANTANNNIGGIDVRALAGQFYRHYHTTSVNNRETTFVLGHTHRYDFTLDSSGPKS